MSEPTPPPETPQPPNRSSERLEEARRRLFERPPEPPFWATTEFRRAGSLIFLLVVVGLAGVAIFWQRSNDELKLAQQEATDAIEGSPIPPDPVLREQMLATSFQGALSDTKNGDGFRETSGYANLMRELASYPVAEVQSKAKRWLDYAGAMKDPDGWRGTFV